MSVVLSPVRVAAGQKRSGMRIDQQVLIKNPRLSSSAINSNPYPLGRPPTDGHPNGKFDGESPVPSNAPAYQVFNTHDIVITALAFVADAEAPEQLLKMSTISRSFRSAALSDLIWKDLCDEKWQRKFGYNNRMNQAMLDAKEDDANDNIRIVHPTIRQYPAPVPKDSFWYRRYWKELKLSSTNTITLQELCGVSWSYCRWFKRPHRHEPSLLRSGLMKPSSNSTRFCYDGIVRGAGGEDTQPFCLKEGGSIVHTCELAFYHCPARTLRVRRLSNWGWELHNQYVVLRSIDVDGHAGIWDDYKHTLCTELKQPGVVSRRYGDDDKIVARIIPVSKKDELSW